MWSDHLKKKILCVSSLIIGFLPLQKLFILLHLCKSEPRKNPQESLFSVSSGLQSGATTPTTMVAGNPAMTGAQTMMTAASRSGRPSADQYPPSPSLEPVKAGAQIYFLSNSLLLRSDKELKGIVKREFFFHKKLGVRAKTILAWDLFWAF